MTQTSMTGIVGDVPHTLLGYRVEYISTVPGQVAYKLHGPTATYTLMRYPRLWTVHSTTLYALNNHGQVCAIKGHTLFTDRTGTLTVGL
jgi:hypothetical protein